MTFANEQFETQKKKKTQKNLVQGQPGSKKEITTMTAVETPIDLEFANDKVIEKVTEKDRPGKTGIKTLFIIIVVILCVLACGAAWWYFKTKNNKKDVLSANETEKMKLYAKELEAFEKQGTDMQIDINETENRLNEIKTQLAAMQKQIKETELKTQKSNTNTKASFDEDLTSTEEESDLNVSFMLKSDSDNEKQSSIKKLNDMRAIFNRTIAKLTETEKSLSDKKSLFFNIYNDTERAKIANALK